MKEIKYILKEIWAKDPIMYGIIAVNAILQGILPLVWILAPAFVIDNWQNGFFYFIPYIIAILIVTGLATFLGPFLSNNYRMRMNRIRFSLIINIITYSLSLPYADQQDKKEREKINNAIKATESPYSGFGRLVVRFPSFISLVISITGFIWIFSKMDNWLLVVTITLTAIQAYITMRLPILEEAYWEDIEEEDEQVIQLSYELSNPISKLDLIMYDFISIFSKYYFSIMDYRDKKMEVLNKDKLKIDLMAKSIGLVRDLLIIYWLITNLFKNLIDLSDFYMIFASSLSFVLFVERLSSLISDYATNIAYFKHYLKILDIKNENYKSYDFDKINIELKNISFKYPSSTDYVLKDINLKINSGESIALVGENGAGKTTLALILSGLLEPTSGQIFVNNHDIKDLNLDLKDITTAVFQDSLVFPYSIRENILLNDSNRDLSKLYQQTGLGEIIYSYEKKDEQILLRTLDDKGVDLSGGQKQRLFLARALGKESAKLLVLDEPTAQLDAIAESELYKLYNQERYGLSSIFISHRLASTKFCDKIIFLKNGEIIETGSHDELLNRDSEYKKLYQIQAKNYKEASHA